MPNRSLITISFLSSFVLAGCASQGAWSPTVDSYGDSHPERITADKVECKELAQQSSGDAITETGKGAVIGGLLGAAAGAVIGAATGSPAKECERNKLTNWRRMIVRIQGATTGA